MKHITMLFAKYIHFKRVGTYFNIYMIVIKKQHYMMRNARKGPRQFTETQARISPRICAGRPGRSLSAYIIPVCISIYRRTATVRIRLHECACSSEPSPLAYAIKTLSHILHHMTYENASIPLINTSHIESNNLTL